MGEPRVTNWLLAGILAVLIVHVFISLDRPVQADALRLDACITERINEAPQQYVHVVAHPAL